MTEIVWITHPDNYPPAVHERARRLGAERVSLLADRGIGVRVVHANQLVAGWVDGPRLWCDEEDLLAQRRGYMVSGWAWDPAAAQHLTAIRRSVQASSSVLLEAGWPDREGLLSDKLAMYQYAGGLGMPVLPTVAVPFGRYARHALPLVSKHCSGAAGYVVKPRELAMGFGVLRVDNDEQLLPAIDLVAASGLGCLVQPFHPNLGDLRVFVHRGRCVAAMLRAAPPGGHVANLPVDTSGPASTAPPAVRRFSERLAGELGLDYLCVDWLLSEAGPVLNEWMTVVAGFEALPEPYRATVADALADSIRRRLGSSR